MPDRSLPEVFWSDRHEQFDEVRDAPGIASSPLMDAMQPVLGGVVMDLEAVGGHLQVEVGVSEGPVGTSPPRWRPSAKPGSRPLIKGNTGGGSASSPS